MDYLITNIEEHRMSGKVMQINQEEVHRSAYLPTEKHPYDHYLVYMEVKI